MRALKLLVAVLLFARASLSMAAQDWIDSSLVKKMQVDLYLNPTGMPANISLAEMEQAIAATAAQWTNITGSQAVIKYRGITSAECLDAGDGISVVCWKPTLPSICANEGVEACHMSLWHQQGVESAIILSISRVQKKHLAFLMNHEGGHALGLGDCKNISSVMCEVRETVSAEDVAAMQYLYPEPLHEADSSGVVLLECVMHKVPGQNGQAYWGNIIFEGGQGLGEFYVSYAAMRSAPAASEGCIHFSMDVDSQGNIVKKNLTFNVTESDGRTYEYETYMEVEHRMVNNTLVYNANGQPVYDYYLVVTKKTLVE